MSELQETRRKLWRSIALTQIILVVAAVLIALPTLNAVIGANLGWKIETGVVALGIVLAAICVWKLLDQKRALILLADYEQTHYRRLPHSAF